MKYSNETILRCNGLGKCYQVYNNPKDRLKQALFRGKRTYFREFWALRNISFEVKRGESLGVIGRNGSGKSTLLQMLCGTLTPTKGDVQTKGKVAALLELGSGFNPEFTGLENVYLNASMLGLNKKETEDQLDNILGFADIGEFIDQPVKTYSSGMSVRLAFSVIAHVNAEILIIDEALAVGDQIFVQRCMQFIRRMREEKCLLFVSHDSEAVKSLCSHALWLHHGEEKSKGTSRDVCREYFTFCRAETNKEEIKPIVNSANRGTEERIMDFEKEQEEKSNFVTSEIYTFKENIIDSDGFKTGKAEITKIEIKNSESENQITFEGGEKVEIVITAVINANLSHPIIGFQIRDSLGQILMGETTYKMTQNTKDWHAEAKNIIKGSFKLWLPHLKNGIYMLTCAVADGTIRNFVQHHWLENAVTIEVSSTEERWGIIGAFISSISVRKEHGN